MVRISRRNFLKIGAAAAGATLGSGALGHALLNPRMAQAQDTLRFWYGLGATQGDPLEEFTQRAAEEIGVEVTFDNFVEDAETKLTAGFGANDIPDMFETDYPFMGGLVLGIGALDPMDDMLAAVDYPLDTIVPFVLDRCRFNGELYAVPHGWNSWVLFYNLDHFEEAGLPTDREPESLEEFIEWSQMLTKRDSNGNITQSGFVNLGSGILPSNIWGALLYQYGGSVVTEDGTATNFNNEAGRAAAEFVLNTFYEWEISDPAVTQRYDYWLTGQGSMFYTGTWVVGSSLTQEGLNFRTGAMPILGDQRAVMYEYSGLVLPFGRSDEVKEQVGQIYKYFAENAGEFAVASSQLPVTVEGLEFEDYVNSDAHQYFTASEENGDSAFWDVAHPESAEFSVYNGTGLVTRVLDRVWSQEITVDEGLNELDEQLTAKLGEQPAAGA